MVGTIATPSQDSHSASPDWFPGIAFALDCLIILTGGVWAYANSDTWLASRLWVYVTLSAAFCLAAGAALTMTGGYKFETIRSPIRRIMRIMIPTIAAYTVVTAAAFASLSPIFLNTDWFLTMALVATLGVILGRSALLVMLFLGCRSGWVKRRVAILGVTPLGQRVEDQLRRDPFRMNAIVAKYDIKHFIDRAQGLDSLISQARAGEIDDVIVTLDWTDHVELSKVIDAISACPVRVHLGESPAAPKLTNRESSEISQGIRTVKLAGHHFTAWQRLLKAIEDRTLAVVFIVLLSPVLILTAIAVRLDSRGPIIYRQPRYGFNNQVFDVFKFRSMTHNEIRTTEEGLKQATKDDPRITRIGAFIRKTSIDELPQLFNVLGGSMSLVGPRPHSVEHNEEYGRLINRYFARHKVKPGITGLAQVNGLRGRTDTLEKMEYRVKYDLYYVENWSILMDLEILALTAVFGFVGSNAY